jgi:hypothetical protein
MSGQSILKMHLMPGDIIQLGKTEILFSLQEPTSPRVERKEFKGESATCTIS